jgi:hypothetical protein
MVKAMAHTDPSNSLTSDSELTIKKLQIGFQYINENTGSDHKGLHHGHWKLLIQDDEAFEPFALMIMFAFCWDEPPNAWKNALQVILPKDNTTKPIKSTQMQNAMMLYNHLSNVQFGTRRGHMSLSTVLLKCTSYNIICLMNLLLQSLTVMLLPATIK